MADEQKPDYSVSDRPEVSKFLFHPRPEGVTAGTDKNVMIPVEKDVAIGARFHIASVNAPNILFFHGNGEIVADYDELGEIYTQMGINFLAADYRGYGASGGSPTVSAMMKDCHAIFDFVRKWLEEKNHTGRLIVMGRSLGSASALELAGSREDLFDGLIIESGFAYEIPLLKLLGIRVGALGLREEEIFGNPDKIRRFDKPVLIIHAESDHIIPFSDGQALYEACSSENKTLLRIPNANHNDILYCGFTEYMNAVGKLISEV